MADLKPQVAWSHTVHAGNDNEKITFELRDHGGKVLLSHTDGKYDWDPESLINVGPQQTFAAPEADQRTEGDWLKLGTDQEANGKLLPAWETYRAALAKYPQSHPLQVAAGRLAASLQHNEEATKLLSEAQKRDTANPEIGYYLGIAQDRLGDVREARAAYEVAYRQPGFQGRAAARIGELLALQGDLHAAERFFSEAADALPADIRSHEQLEAVVRAQGDTLAADRLAHAGLALDPMSDFLKEEIGAPDLPHLAADPYRVLRVATEYMQLGLYAKALAVLGRTYPAVPADQSEPGSVLPQQHPMVLYYAAYCDSKLGHSASVEWQAAKKLSSRYVFPSSMMDRMVLEAALAADADDASAHYLLGTLLFSKGLYDAGMEQWAEAKRLAPHMPTLDADMGEASLQLNSDVTDALTAFQSGLENDPTNADIYSGLDQAMSLSSVPAKDRARALSRFPGVADGPAPASMPSNLVYQLALTRAEAGEYDTALALFKGRFFPSEEGGVSATQVMFEIELMKVAAEAAAGQCATTKELLSKAQPGLALNGAVARDYLREALAARSCKLDAQSRELLEKAADSKNNADAAWAAKASALLGRGTAHQQTNLEASLASADRVKDTSSYTGWWWYSMGTIEAALHRIDRAQADFRKALLLPDSMMSHHLSRAAIAELNADKS